MRTKIVAVAVVLGIAGACVIALQSTNRADAAAGNCYSDAKGPSTPTICN